MKPQSFLFSFFVLCLYLPLRSQNECATPESNLSGSAPTAVESAPCFDVEQVFEDCAPVYLNVNLHIFSTSDCQGQIQELDCNQTDGFALAEQLIDRANTLNANNPEQWPRQEPHVIVCNPIRYVLRGIYAHCKDDASISSDLWNLQSTFGVDPGSVFNFYVADYAGTPTGVVNGISGHFGGVENQSEGNFNHEIGHLLSLKHADNPGDLCDDTSPVFYNWDADCDGVLEPDEMNLLCWGLETDSTVCNPEPPCTSSPCCSWDFQNNNCMMSKSAYQEAFSKCQIQRMLTQAATGACDYVAQIGGAGPPNAFITQTAWDAANTVYCNECLILSASFNDEGGHSLNIYEGTGNSIPLIYSSGWESGPAKNFCYSTVEQKDLTINVLKPNTTYTAVLTVRNGANVEDTNEFVFTTPGTDCSVKEPDPKDRLTVSPNPTNGSIVQLKFETNSEIAPLTVQVAHQISGASQVLLTNYTPIVGENIISINISTLPAGPYSVNVSNSTHFYQTQLIKF